MIVAPQPEPSPMFWLGARALTHVGEYRRHYALLGLWMAMMLLAPRVGLGTSFVATEPPVANRPSVVAPVESALGAAIAPAAASAVPTFFADEVLADFTATSDDFASLADENDVAAPATSAPVFAPFVPPASGDDAPPAADAPASPISIPPPPPLPLPVVPTELRPLVAVVSPLANTACSPIGLAGVLVALVAPSVQPIPAAQLVPYLTPLYVACGSFPQVGPRSVCAIDDAYVSQDPTGGLLPPPAVIGLGVDTLSQLEKATTGATAQADMIRAQLQCRRG